MINADLTTPNFPEEIGVSAAIEFIKNGRMYRLMRLDEDLWVIHQAGVPTESFQLLISDMSRNRRDFTVTGRNGVGPIMGASATPSILFGKLF